MIKKASTFNTVEDEEEAPRLTVSQLKQNLMQSSQKEVVKTVGLGGQKNSSKSLNRIIGIPR